MIVIRFPDALYALDPCHLRHFYEVLWAHNDVIGINAIDSRHADYSFSLPGRQADRRIHFCRHDPHIAVADIGIDNLIDPSMEGALDAIEASHHQIDHIKRAFPAELAKKWPRGELIADIDRYDIFAPNVLDPWDKGVIQGLRKAKFLWIPMSVPGEIFNSTCTEHRPLDVFFLGVAYHYYPIRILMIQALKDDKSISFKHAELFTGSEENMSACRKDLSIWDDHQRWYASKLRSAKIMPFCGSIFNYPVQKYYEAMACGCLVVAPIPKDADRLGFVDGETMVAVDHVNFMDKIKYYLAHDEERLAITKAAHKLAHSRYTCEAQSRILVSKLKAIRAGHTIEEMDQYPDGFIL